MKRKITIPESTEIFEYKILTCFHNNIYTSSQTIRICMQIHHMGV